MYGGTLVSELEWLMLHVLAFAALYGLYIVKDRSSTIFTWHKGSKSSNIMLVLLLLSTPSAQRLRCSCNHSAHAIAHDARNTGKHALES